MCFCTTVATNNTFTVAFPPHFRLLSPISKRPINFFSLLSSVKKRLDRLLSSVSKRPPAFLSSMTKTLSPQLSSISKRPRLSFFGLRAILYCEKVSGRKRCMYDTKDRKFRHYRLVKALYFGCFPGTVFHAKEVHLPDHPAE